MPVPTTSRRRFLLGAGVLAAPSIIGISGIIQLSRPRLILRSKSYWEVTVNWTPDNIPAGFEAMEPFGGLFDPEAPAFSMNGEIIRIPILWA